MPIRLNLLAEAQAAEELRRRDPVKRMIWLAAFLIFLMLGWAGYLQLRVMLASSELSTVASKMMLHTNEYQKVISDKKFLDETKEKVSKLDQLSSARFLQGSLLNALQHTTVPDVSIYRLRLDQSYSGTEGVKPKTNDEGVVTRGKPATATEKMMLTLDGVDASPKFDQYSKLQESLAAYPYFKATLAKTNPVSLRSGSLSSPQVSAGGKSCVFFTLECRYPDKTR